MLKKLIQFLLPSKLFNKNRTNKVALPNYIDDAEKIVRVLFYPIYVAKNKKKIKPIAYRSPWEKDEVSVSRLDYCSPTFCKQLGKRMESPENNKTFFGFGLLTAQKIRNLSADVVYTRMPDNDYHADIKFGYIPKKGVQFPAEYQYQYQEMANIAKLHEDPYPSSNTWEGDDLIC